MTEELFKRTEKEYSPNDLDAKAVAAALGYDLAY